MRKIVLLALMLFVFGCSSNKNLRISVDDFKRSYATNRIEFNYEQDYKTVYRRVFQAMRDCYSQPGFASLVIFGSSPNMVVTGELYEDIQQAQIIYGINRPTAGQQKDIYIEIERDSPSVSRIGIYSWNTNITNAEIVAKSIKEFILYNSMDLYGCSVKK